MTKDPTPPTPALNLLMRGMSFTEIAKALDLTDAQAAREVVDRESATVTAAIDRLLAEMCT